LRNQQFAIRPTQPAEALRELEEIHFLTTDNQDLTSPTALLLNFYDLSWPEYQDHASVTAQLANLMATPDEDGWTYLTTHDTLPVTVSWVEKR